MSDNPDPRLDEIQARLDVHVKCTDCGKCRVSVTEEWCPECDYWACEGGLACADDPYPADVSYLLAELRKAREALARVEALHKPVTVYELDDVNGTWIYDGDEKRVLTTLCAECTPDFVLSEIEEGDYDGGGSDADIYWPCPTKAAVAAAKETA